MGCNLLLKLLHFNSSSIRSNPNNVTFYFIICFLSYPLFAQLWLGFAYFLVLLFLHCFNRPLNSFYLYIYRISYVCYCVFRDKMCNRDKNLLDFWELVLFFSTFHIFYLYFLDRESLRLRKD
jgi:hypothetical protein